jgi:glycosyltransferase involved in cell wall biosynthesis
LEIVYTGMVYPGRRDPSSLFKALAALGAERRRVRVKFFGRMLPGVEEIANRYGVGDCVEVHEPVPYQESLRRQMRADVLLLLLWNDPREQGVYTGKLFEYLGARRPILSIGLEDGVAATLVREKRAGLATDDPAVIARQLRSWLEQKTRDGSIPPTPVDAGLGFSREDQFVQLESFIEARLEEGRSRRVSRSPPVDRDVLVVIGKLDLGGTENHLLKVLPRLAERGVKVRILAMRGGGALDGAMREAGVPVIRMPRVAPTIGFVLSAFRLLWLYLRERPDLVHFFLPQAYVIGGLCALLVGQRPRAMSRRSLNFYQSRNRLTRPLERWLHRRMDAVLGNSKAVVAQLREEGVPEDRLGLIYNGVDTTTYASSESKAELRRRLGLPESDLVIVHVANLIRYKGHADLIAALASVEDRMPAPWRLLLVGRDDGIGGELHARVKVLGLGEHVGWLGERRDIPAILGAADIGVLPSHEEGFSNSILECMAAGLPMVVTDVGGNPEAVRHGVTGLVVPPADSRALGQAILTLSQDPRLRAAMGERAREIVRAELSLDETVERYWRLYRQLLAPSPSLSVEKVVE